MVKRLLFLLVVLSLCTTAFAHTGHETSGGFVSGLKHPLFGLDHMVAMIAVGIWAAAIGRRAIWLLPVVFPVVMTIGAIMAFSGLALPAVEAGIAASAIVIGVLLALALRAPLWLAAAVVGLFALFHGNAHGSEIPLGASAAGYCIGFVIATAALHLAGIGIGLAARLPHGSLLARLVGGVTACLGAAFLLGWL